MERNKSIIMNINNKMNINYFAKKIFRLDYEMKLIELLIGNISTRLYVYKKSETGNDIIEVYKIILLSPPFEQKNNSKFVLSKYCRIC